MAPVRFETIAKKMDVALETVREWSGQPGFPAAGDGVADLAAVQEWRNKVANPEQDVDSLFSGPCDTGQPGEPVFHQFPHQQENSIGGIEQPADVQWVTIRVPVLMDAAKVPTNHLAVRINASEQHIRSAIGKVHHGAKSAHVTLKSGQHCDKLAQSLKWVFEQIAKEVEKLQRV